MSRGSRSSLRTATLLATLLAAAPVAAQTPTPQNASLAVGSVSPRQIAAAAHASLLLIRAMDANGDTLGLGTGFLVSPDGRFVTNYHVIQEAAKLSVKVLDGAEYADVQLVAADPATDLALMQLPNVRGLPSMPLGSDLQVEVGDRVFVMGNPMGMSGTFTDGMISGKRPLEGVAMLQMSAPISAGSSGGPVMNERGEVIGIATMMVMGGQNLNMAVPVRYLRPMLASSDAPRTFSPAALAGGRRAGLALLGDGPEPRDEPRRPAVREPRREVEAQFAMVSPMLQMRGYQPAYPTALGEAAQARPETHEFRLEQGVPYLITARCDAECHDMALVLADSRGRVVQSDPDGAFPTVLVVPQATGTYRVAVRLAECASPACAYGVAVFRRDPATAQAGASKSAPSRPGMR